MVKPATCSFDVIRNLTDEEIRLLGYPPNVREWAWFSAVELLDAAQTRLEYCCKEESVVTDIPKIDLKNFAQINDYAKGEFSWFIATGRGFLQTYRPYQSCPFDDPCLYVPAKWGESVIKATCDGVASIKELHGIAGTAKVIKLCKFGSEKLNAFEEVEYTFY